MDLKDLLSKVKVGEETVLDVSGEPGDRKLTVSMRALNPEAPREPKRAESPARKHELLSAKSLADYLGRYGSGKSVVFADHEAETISAVIDETARDGVEIVTMRPAPHPLWKPWAGLAGKTLKITEFAAFVAQNRRAVAKPEGRSLALVLSQVRAAVTVEIERGRGKSAVNGVMVRSKIQGVDKSEVVEIPDALTLHVPLYVDTAPKDVELDLCLDATREGEVTVVVSGGTVAEARVAAFNEMLEVVRAGAASIGAVLTLGRPAHRPWAYLGSEKS